MGGLSEGFASVESGRLVFDGFINTNGGGFTSVRRNVPVETFADTTSLRVRYRSEPARTYEFWVDVDNPDLDPRLSFFGELPPNPGGDFAFEAEWIDACT